MNNNRSTVRARNTLSSHSPKNGVDRDVGSISIALGITYILRNRGKLEVVDPKNPTYMTELPNEHCWSPYCEYQ